MARHYGKVLTAIWNDPDFRALNGEAQRVYLMLITQADITSVGTLPITLRRWVGYSLDGTSKGLQRGITELENKAFVVLDWDREELLVRSFVKWDEGWKNGLRLKAIQSAATVVASPALQVVLSAELDKLGVMHSIPKPVEVRDIEAPSKPLEGDIEAPRTVVTLVSTSHTPQSAISIPHSGNRPASPPATDVADDPRPDVDRVCELLAKRIEGNGSKRPTISAAWLKDARLLMDKDGRTEDQVVKAIEWSQADSFWRINIMSMPKLREQFDKLRLAAQAQQEAAFTKASPRSTTDDRVQGALDVAAEFEREEQTQRLQIGR